jgi:hypothetical protein
MARATYEMHGSRCEEKISVAPRLSVLVNDRADQSDIVFFPSRGWLAVELILRDNAQAEACVQSRFRADF